MQAGSTLSKSTKAVQTWMHHHTGPLEQVIGRVKGKANRDLGNRSRRPSWESKKVKTNTASILSASKLMWGTKSSSKMTIQTTKAKVFPNRVIFRRKTLSSSMQLTWVQATSAIRKFIFPMRMKKVSRRKSKDCSKEKSTSDLKTSQMIPCRLRSRSSSCSRKTSFRSTSFWARIVTLNSQQVVRNPRVTMKALLVPANLIALVVKRNTPAL